MAVHLFAIYIQQLPEHKIFQLTDPEIYKRLVEILRVSSGQELILFDGHNHLQCIIGAISKKSVVLEIHKRFTSPPQEPRITWLLPLIEREQWEHALYSLAAMGINEIIPIIMAQSKVNWGTPKDYERSQRIMIAACEQAKQFVIPKLQQVQEFSKAVSHYALQHQNIFFDADTKPLKLVLKVLTDNEPILCISGPEGGFIDKEIMLLKEHNFMSCALTPTTLKASHAVALGAGILRSWFNRC